MLAPPVAWRTGHRLDEGRPITVTVAVAVVAWTAALLLVPEWRLRVPATDLRTPFELVGAVTVVHAALVLALPTGHDVRPARSALLSGLLVLGLANATTTLRLSATTFGELASPTIETGSWIAARYLASALFVLGGLERPRAGTSRYIGAAVACWLVVDVLLLTLGPHVGPRPLVVLDGTPVGPGMAVVQAVPALLFGLGSWLAARLHRRSGADEYRWVALALQVQVAAQVHEILFPAFQGPWLTSADVLRMGSFVLLAIGAAVQVRRLSRERIMTIEQQRDDLAHRERLVEDLTDVAEREAHFRTIVAHELATPVATIGAYAHVIARDPARACQTAGALTAEASRLGELVTRMEELRDLDLRQLRCELRAVGVRPLVEDGCAFARTAGRGHDVVADVDDAEVLVDPVRFGQALRNVLANAVRIAPAGTPVRVTGRRVGDCYSVSVRDLGPGIHPDERRRVLQPFTRGTTAAGGTGRGVGLYLARQILTAHGGQLTIDEVDGPGARVTLRVRTAT